MASLLYFVLRVECRRKTVHVSYLISWWASYQSQVVNNCQNVRTDKRNPSDSHIPYWQSEQHAYNYI